MDELFGKTFGSWLPLSVRTDNPNHDDANPIYDCNCLKCGVTHVVSKTNIISCVACPTCPSKPKAPMADIVEMFAPLLGLNSDKKKEVSDAFDKLNQPEFKDIYSSLERASKSIKNVMNGDTGSSDVARKILEIETVNLKKSFNDLIRDGKISEEEVRVLKTEVNSSANMQKLRSVLENMKHETAKKTKI